MCTHTYTLLCTCTQTQNKQTEKPHTHSHQPFLPCCLQYHHLDIWLGLLWVHNTYNREKSPSPTKTFCEMTWSQLRAGRCRVSVMKWETETETEESEFCWGLPSQELSGNTTCLSVNVTETEELTCSSPEWIQGPARLKANWPAAPVTPKQLWLRDIMQLGIGALMLCTQWQLAFERGEALVCHGKSNPRIPSPTSTEWQGQLAGN